MTTTLEYAEFYVNDCGFSVIPLKEHEKIPAVKWKEYQDRKPTDKELKKWFGNGSKFNIAIVTGKISNLTVVDVDNDAGMEFAKKNCTLTPAVRTGSGKYHFYYKYQEGSRNYQKRSYLDGIDLKSEGGTITAPPSIHPTTLKPYEWSLKEMIGEIPTVELPSVFYGKNGKTFTKTEDGKILQGQRDEFLTSQAGAMRARGMSEQAILSALMIENYQKCEPPLAETQVKKIAKSVQRYKPTAEPKTKKEEITSPYFLGKKFIQLFLADEIMKENTFITCNHHLYMYTEGVFQPIGDEFIRTQCRLKLKEDANINRINEVIAHVRDMSVVNSNQLNTYTNLINVKNGMLDWRENSLLPHNEKYISTIQIPVDFKPDAECQQIDIFLSQVLPHDCFRLMVEILGYFLIPDTKYEKAILLTGSGCNGKSTLLHLVEHLIGTCNISNVDLQDLGEHPFKRAELLGKLVNLVGDIDNTTMKKTSVFKAVVSGEMISAEEKYKPGFAFKPTARLIFSANELPRSYDKTEAMLRRMLIIPFPNSFLNNKDENLIKKLTSEAEMQGLLNHAITGLNSLVTNKGFFLPDSVQSSLKQYEVENNVIELFITEACVEDALRECDKRMFYKAFVIYCDENNYKPVGKIAFNKAIANRKNIQERKSGRDRLFTGISLVEIE